MRSQHQPATVSASARRLRLANSRNTRFEVVLAELGGDSAAEALATTWPAAKKMTALA